MEFYISTLILEVTRRCNMHCGHCLRGTAQNKNITNNVIDRVLDAAESHGLGTVTFTGGEPALNVPAIRYFADQLEARKINFSGFYVVTNGKVESLPLVHALIDLYALCDEPEVCGLEVSGDQFHEQVKPSRVYWALKFFNKDARKERLARENVIREGRGRYVGTGKRYGLAAEWEFDRYSVDYATINSDVYVSCNGNVLSGCDFSFRRIDKEAVGNVLREPLSEILERQYNQVMLKEAA